jgi:hypothetical protein
MPLKNIVTTMPLKNIKDKEKEKERAELKAAVLFDMLMVGKKSPDRNVLKLLSVQRQRGGKICYGCMKNLLDSKGCIHTNKCKECHYCTGHSGSCSKCEIIEGEYFVYDDYDYDCDFGNWEVIDSP